jgi:hypothetical protein
MPHINTNEWLCIIGIVASAVLWATLIDDTIPSFAGNILTIVILLLLRRIADAT